MSDWDSWNQQQRVRQDHWDSATSSGQYAPTSSQSSGWSSPSSSGTYGSAGGSYNGGYSGGRSYGWGGPTFLSIIPFIPALPVLYPLPFAVAFAGAGIGYGVLESVFTVYTASGQNWLAAGASLIAAVLFFGLTRLDTRMAASQAWRLPRHLLRLALVMVIAHVAAVALLSTTGQPLEDAALDLAIVRNPAYLGGVAVAVVLAHIVLTRPALQAWWHVRLEKAWLTRAS